MNRIFFLYIPVWIDLKIIDYYDNPHHEVFTFQYG